MLIWVLFFMLTIVNIDLYNLPLTPFCQVHTHTHAALASPTCFLYETPARFSRSLLNPTGSEPLSRLCSHDRLGMEHSLLHRVSIYAHKRD